MAPAKEGSFQLVVEPAASVDDGPGNLVSRAARELWRHIGRRPGARVTLRKRIPVGGGLGGGSADAAAALVLFIPAFAYIYGRFARTVLRLARIE